MNASAWSVTISKEVWASIRRYHAERLNTLLSFQNTPPETATEIDAYGRALDEIEAHWGLQDRIEEIETASLDLDDASTLRDNFDRIHVTDEHGKNVYLYRLKPAGVWRCYFDLDFDLKSAVSVRAVHRSEDTQRLREEIVR